MRKISMGEGEGKKCIFFYFLVLSLDDLSSKVNISFIYHTFSINECINQYLNDSNIYAYLFLRLFFSNKSDERRKNRWANIFHFLVDKNKKKHFSLKVFTSFFLPNR